MTGMGRGGGDTSVVTPRWCQGSLRRVPRPRDAAVPLLAAAGPDPPAAGPAAPAGPPGGGGGRGGRRGGLRALGRGGPAATGTLQDLLLEDEGPGPPRAGRRHLRGAPVPAPPGLGAAAPLRHPRSHHGPTDAAAPRFPSELVLLEAPSPGVQRPLPSGGPGSPGLRSFREATGQGELPAGAPLGGRPRGHRGPGDARRDAAPQVHPGGARLGGAAGLGGGHQVPGPGGQVGHHGRSSTRHRGRFRRLPRLPAPPLQLRLPLPAALAARDPPLLGRLRAVENLPDGTVDWDPEPGAAADGAGGGRLSLQPLPARGVVPPTPLLPQPLPGHPDRPGAAAAPHAAALGLPRHLPGRAAGAVGSARPPARRPPARAARRRPLAARGAAPAPRPHHRGLPRPGPPAPIAAPEPGGGSQRLGEELNIWARNPTSG